MFVCLQVSLGGTSSFLATAVHFVFVFFVLWALIDIYLGKFNLLYIVVWFILFFLGSFRDCFICSINQWTRPFCAGSFSFFLARLAVFFPPFYMHIHCTLNTTCYP